jgi:RNA polymerase sigma factor (sigma-70 family)
MTTDSQLLGQYVDRGDEAAFREIVQRHLSLVYFAALRRTGNRHVAEEVSQYVFTVLAREAHSLCRHTALTGWLYTTTRFASAKLLRSERRRRRREEEAHLMQDLSASGSNDADWQMLRPLVDAALDGLSERDREAVLLRYFEGQSFADIGTSLGLTEDAARMRVGRALEKLHALLGKRGVSSTAAAVGVALAGQAAAAVPSGLATTVTAGALSGAAVVSGSAGALHLIQFMSTAKIITGAAVVVALGATALTLQQHRASVRLAEQVANLQAQVASSESLRAENARLTTQKAAAEEEARTARAELNHIREVIAAKRAAAAAGQHATPETASADKTGKSSGKLAPGMTSLELMQDVGRATPSATAQTIAYAIAHGEIKLAATALELEPADRAKMEAFIASLPEAARARFGTPEDVIALMMVGTPKPISGVQLLNRAQPDSDTEVQNIQLQYESGEVKQMEVKFHREADGWKQMVSSDIVDRVILFLGAKK